MVVNEMIQKYNFDKKQYFFVLGGIDYMKKTSKKQVRGQYLYDLWQRDIIVSRTIVDTSMKDEPDVYQDIFDTSKYVKYGEAALSDAEITHMYEIKRTEAVQSIKNMVTFFIILIAISLIIMVLSIFG